LESKLGTLPDTQLIESLYAPDVATEVIGEDKEEYRTYRIRVGDVIVRYVEELYAVQVTIEGELSKDIVEQLKNDIMQKFAALERTPIGIYPRSLTFCVAVWKRVAVLMVSASIFVGIAKLV
jgi:hypothetical protein